MKKIIILISLLVVFQIADCKPQKYNHTEIIVKASTMVLIPVLAITAAPVFALVATVAVITEFVIFDVKENKPIKRKMPKCK